MGSGFKDWSPGDVLTAADVDGYLMRQTAMTFADASARDTALSGVLDEGMIAYLEDADLFTFYDGSTWKDIAAASTIGTWTSFTPVWTNVTVGNGTVVGEYCEVNELVFYRIQLTFGSTTSFTSSIAVDTPTSMDSGTIGATGGMAYLDDTNGSDYFSFLYRSTNSRVLPRVANTSGTYMTVSPIDASTPFTWATGDSISIVDWYKKA